jgi:hypothetical protein
MRRAPDVELAPGTGKEKTSDQSSAKSNIEDDLKQVEFLKPNCSSYLQ